MELTDPSTVGARYMRGTIILSEIIVRNFTRPLEKFQWPSMYVTLLNIFSEFVIVTGKSEHYMDIQTCWDSSLICI